MNLQNRYQGMAEFYDRAMLAGYYDYEKTAKSLSKYIKNGSSILEIGVGTGLFMEQLYKNHPDCAFYGIDHTAEMLKQAYEKLNSNVKLKVEDIIEIKFNEPFDFIYSHGGVWVFLNEILLSHIQQQDANLKGLKNVLNGLKNNGIFAVNIQPMHKNSESILDDGTIFRQDVMVVDEICIKDYIFIKNGEILSQQRCTYRLWQGDCAKKLIEEEVGFTYIGLSEDKNFRLYKK